MDGHQIVLAEKEVDVMGPDALAVAGVIVDAVENRVDVAVVRLNLGVLNGAPRVFDRQRMKRKRVAQNERFRNRRRREINPYIDRGTGQQPGPVDAGYLFGLAVPVNVDANQT